MAGTGTHGDAGPEVATAPTPTPPTSVHPSPTPPAPPAEPPAPQAHPDPATTDDPVDAGGDTAFEWSMEFPPDLGEPMGRIRIPKATVDQPIVHGVNSEHLRLGPGHMPRTAVPGQFGNAVIAGHRTTFGAPFYHLDLLEPGDEIHVDTGIGTHTYEVVSTEIVLPTAMWTVQHRAGGWLTLIACHPKGSAAQRIIVFARIVDGPNATGIEAAYAGPYAPPQDPEAAVTRRHHRQVEALLRRF